MEEKVLSQIELDSRRKSLLKKIYLLAVTFFICAVITGLFDLLNDYKLYRAYTSLPNDAPQNFKVQSLASIVFLVLYGIMLPLQAYFFFRFVSKMSDLDLDMNGEQFYLSFNWLLKQTFVAAILFGINAIWAIIDVITFY